MSVIADAIEALLREREHLTKEEFVSSVHLGC